MPPHHQLDILFVSPDSSAKAYQELAKKVHSGQEPVGGFWLRNLHLRIQYKLLLFIDLRIS